MAAIGSSSTLNDVQPPPLALFGASGAIGRHVLAAWRRDGGIVVGTSRRGGEGLLSFDLQAEPWDLTPFPPCRVALLLAGMSEVLACEADPATATRINAQQSARLAGLLHRRGMRVLYASTDYVFDGQRGGYREEDQANPIVAYGRSKLAGEEAVLAATEGQACILRLSKVFSHHGGEKDIFAEMVALLRAGKKVHAARDQRFNPIEIQDLLAVLRYLTAVPLAGVLHVCGDHAASRLEMAQTLARLLGVREGVQAMDLGQLPGPKRPTDTSMNNSLLHHQVPVQLTPLAESLRLVARHAAFQPA